MTKIPLNELKAATEVLAERVRSASRDIFSESEALALADELRRISRLDTQWEIIEALEDLPRCYREMQRKAKSSWLH